jgi:hypothetical protein
MREIMSHGVFGKRTCACALHPSGDTMFTLTFRLRPRISAVTNAD